MSRENNQSKTSELQMARRLLSLKAPPEASLAALESSPYAEVRELLTRHREKELLEDRRLDNMLIYERELWQRGVALVAGLDEAGRGPLAGPVATAAVILDPVRAKNLRGLDDSKKLSPQKRYQLEITIKEEALYWAVAWQNHREIDRDNILQATKTAMLKAVGRLAVRPQYLLLDAVTLRAAAIPQNAIIKGDQKSLSIAAASILAKCWRDRIMDHFDLDYPQYDFIKHKGYPTAGHRERLALYGPSPIHRRSFIVKGGLK